MVSAIDMVFMAAYKYYDLYITENAPWVKKITV